MSKIIYLDYHSTTPCDPRVISQMMPYFNGDFANPSNNYHYLGRKASSSIEEAREKIAELIKADTGQIIFTSGATESNNLAILGAARGYKGKRKKIITTPIEHKSVIKSFAYLERHGFDLAFLPVDHTGTVISDCAKDIIDENTLLVSIHVANNEIGTIQPVDKIANMAHEKGAFVHCDAAQATGKIPLNVCDLNIDFLSISAHKLYGPKGVGGLYIKKHRSIPLEPLFWGGDQERELRPGTYNVPGIVGFGEACQICQREMKAEAIKTKELRDLLEYSLVDCIQDIKINGNINNRLSGNSNIIFPGIEGDALLLNLPQLALSIGSACNTGALEPSYVLTAIGLPREAASSSIRFGIGRFTTEVEIREAVDLIRNAYFHLLEKL